MGGRTLRFHPYPPSAGSLPWESSGGGRATENPPPPRRGADWNVCRRWSKADNSTNPCGGEGRGEEKEWIFAHDEYKCVRESAAQRERESLP